MNKFFTTAIAMLLATAANADTQYARVTRVDANYGYVKVNTPVQRCEDVQVAIYGETQGANGGDVLMGMIIGGLLGKGVTGKDNGAAAGAVFGGVIAADKGSKQVVTGHRLERQCSTVNQVSEERQVVDYKITYEWQGVKGTSRTYNYYNVGDRLPVTVSIIAQ